MSAKRKPAKPAKPVVEEIQELAASPSAEPAPAPAVENELELVQLEDEKLLTELATEAWHSNQKLEIAYETVKAVSNRIQAKAPKLAKLPTEGNPYFAACQPLKELNQALNKLIAAYADCKASITAVVDELNREGR